jgi:tryptophan synthase beta chain
MPDDLRDMPTRTNRPGWFGDYGGRYVAETLMPALVELDRAFTEAWADPAFRAEYDRLMVDFVGRETPLTHARRLSQEVGGAQIWLKREDLCHTGAHKINNAIGQALLTKRMGKKRIIADTGAGQHGVACATAAALLGLECTVFMGAVDVRRQAPNVQRMELLGATIVPVEDGTKTLKDAVSASMQEWLATSETSHFLLGSVVGPAPFPAMVRAFHAVIGDEARRQIIAATGGLPTAVVACVGGGSNAVGIFQAFLDDAAVDIVGVQAGGPDGLSSASLVVGKPGVFHGAATYVIQDADGQVPETQSVAAGLDYPAVGPEHAFLKDIGRARYLPVSDQDALLAFRRLARTEGLIPAMESAHAVAAAIRLAQEMPADAVLLVNLSGRGDKDMANVMPMLARLPA